MEISEESRNMIVREIKFVRNKIKEEKDPRKKAYFFSGTYTILPRIYNFEYDPHLQFIQLVLNVAYNAIMQRLGAIAGGDVSVPFPDDFFDKADMLLERLQKRIEDGEDAYAVLEKISNLVFLLSGNGYYLTLKGVKVFSE